MRTIKFRAKDTETNRWVYGSIFIRYSDKLCDSIDYAEIEGVDIYNVGENLLESTFVDYDTICQLSGLFDTKGKPIYEGDILRLNNYANVVCVFRHGVFGYVYAKDFHSFAGNTNFIFNPKNQDADVEIVGNIFDNPELIESE